MTGWIWYQEQTLLSFIVKKNILQNWLEIYSYLVLCRRAMNCLSSAIHLIHINAICCTFEGKEICAKIFKIIKSSLIFLLDLYVESVFILQFWCQFGDEKLPPIVFCLKSKVTKIQSERNDLKVVGNKNLVL